MIRIFFLSLLSLSIYASELTRFKNCYALFTGERVDPSSNLYLQVKIGNMKGSLACQSVLESAKFLSNGQIQQEDSGNYNQLGMKVLAHMTQVHRSFFKVPSYVKERDITHTNAAADIFDDAMPTYYFTNSLFNSSFQHRQVVSSTKNLAAIRYSTQKVSRADRSIYSGTSIRWSNALIDGTQQSYPWTNDFIEMGKLVGLKEDHRSLSYNHHLGAGRAVFDGVEANNHFGAGVLGSISYILGNVGKYRLTARPDGGLKSYRRWSYHVANDLLCRDLPLLRSSDVVQDVEASSTLPYRQSKDCMRCHSYMDPLAASIRNVAIIGPFSPNLPFIAYKQPVSEPSLAEVIPRLKGDAAFYKRAAKAQLKFRSYDGTLINKSASSLQEIGNFLANYSQVKDFYACSAKKYYKYLTGIDASLSDLADPQAAQLNSTETYHRNKVIQLGEDLARHQDLSQTVMSIIDSDSFLEPGKRR